MAQGGDAASAGASAAAMAGGLGLGAGMMYGQRMPYPAPQGYPPPGYPPQGYPPPDYPPTLSLGFVEYVPTRVLDGIKSLSYGANVLATRLARERGFDEALLVTPHGRVLEGPTSSLLAGLGGRLVTPPLDEHVLDSITRRRLLEVADVAEEPLTTDDLRRASGAALVSTTREVQPVHRIEDIELDLNDPLIQGAAAQVRERIASEIAALT